MHTGECQAILREMSFCLFQNRAMRGSSGSISRLWPPSSMEQAV